MPYVNFSKLTDAQKQEVFVMYPSPWSAGPYSWYNFWIKPDGHLTKQKGRHQLTEAGYLAWKEAEFGMLSKGGVYRPDKGDLQGWKPGHSFTFIKD